MAGNLGLLARLRLRHLRGDARFLLFAVGTDIDEDRGFLERAYQAYLAIILAASLALSWAQVIDIVGGLRAAIGEATSSWLASALLLLAPALAILAWGVSGIRETPIRLSGPDIAWLARVVRPEELFVVQLAGSAAGIAAAGALGGTLLAALAAGPWATWVTAAVVVLLTARLFVLDTVLPRSAAAPHARRAATGWAGVVVTTMGVGLVAASGFLAELVPAVLTPVSLPAALAADALLLAGAVSCAGRADMAFVVDDNELYAARCAMRFLALVDGGAYREACRRRRARRGRQARRTWRFGAGRAAAVSHGLLSLARRPASVLDLLAWGALLVPMGSLVMVANAGLGVLLSWLVCASLSLRTPAEIGRVFREDCRNRLVRSLLPFGRLELLLLDALPALAVTLASSVAASSAAAHALGADAPLAALLAVALDLLLLLSCGLDDPAAPVRLGSVLVTGFAGAVASLFLVGLASLLGAAPALVCALLVDALLARALR